MVKQAFFELAVALLVFLVSTQMVKGFATPKCQHAQLRLQLKETFDCLDNSVSKHGNKMMGMYEEEMTENKSLPATCQVDKELLGEHFDCLNAFATACFDDKTIRLVKKASSVFVFDCPSANAFILEGQKMASGKGGKFVEFGHWFSAIFVRSMDMGDYLDALLKFDNECNWMEKGE